MALQPARGVTRSLAPGLDPRRSVALPGAFGLALACVVVALHLAALGPDPSTFVRAAPPLAEPGRTPPSLHVLQPEQGYDGQFFYRLAVDPSATRDVGIALDIPTYRQQRLVYPLLARLVALGREDWVPWSLIAVNLAGLGVLGVLGARYLLDLGRPAWWAVALPLYAGFSYTLARDLSEIVQACLFVGALLAARRGRAGGAAVLIALAVLARETAVVLALALLGSAAWTWLEPAARARPGRGRWGPPRLAVVAALAGGAGVGTYVLVQVALWLRWGVPPLLAGSGNLALPLSQPWQYVLTVGRLGRVEVGWLVGLVGAAALVRGAPLGLRLGLLGFVTLLVSLSWRVWSGDAAWLRAATEASLLAWLVLFHGPPRWVHVALLASAVLWPAVARWAIGT